MWRTADGDETAAIAVARSTGKAYVHPRGTVEPPGHRACMLYAAAAAAASCPEQPRAEADSGADTGSVLGFESFEYAYADYVMFLFHGLHEFRPHADGQEHMAALAEAVARESLANAAAGTPVPPECPPYLLDDEEAAELRQLLHLRAV